MKSENKGWVIVSQGDYILDWSFRMLRKDAIQELVTGSQHTWKQWYQRGMRCVKAVKAISVMGTSDVVLKSDEHLQKVAEHIAFPVKYDPDGLSIVDNEGKPLFDVRGWGWVQYIASSEVERMQDAMGESIAAHINKNWSTL